MSEKKPTVAIFPGTFDPVTNGHIDLIRRGLQLFDELIIAIGENPEKAQLFTAAQRKTMIEQVLAEENLNARIECYSGLTVDFAQQAGATAMLRGIRDSADLKFEVQLALTNRVVADLETVFILADEQYAFTSSSLIKQIAAGGKIDRLAGLLSKLVIDKLKEKVESKELTPIDLANH